MLFKLQGDIFSVCTSIFSSYPQPCGPHLLYSIAHTSVITHQSLCYTTASTLGCVNSMDRETNMFKVVSLQWIEGGTVDNKLTMFAFVKPLKRFPFLYYHVPNQKGMVDFSSTIQGIQNKTLNVNFQTIFFLNNKTWPSARTLAMYSKIPIKPC